MLGRKLVDLREAAGYTRVQAARLSGIKLDMLGNYEEANLRPSMPRLIRLAALYGADPLEILTDVTANFRKQREPLFGEQVEALLYFCGVTPEQVAARAHRISEYDLDRQMKAVPLAELLKRRRDDHPARVRGSLLLRHEYEAGASIRELSAKHGLAFGTIRCLLVEANTCLRRQGRRASSV